MNVAFLQSEGCNTQETGACLQLLYVPAAAITHTGPQSSGQLRDHYLNASFVWNHPLDSLGDQFSFKKCALLSVAVPAARFHCFYGAHSPVDLVTAVLVQH